MAFTYSWFLLGLFTMAIPIAIHLYELRRPQRVLFTNVGFIKEVKLITAKQRKLKHILVLLSRLGFLSFLVLVFAQPYIPAVVDDLSSQSLVGVTVDSSPSMQADEADGQSKFDEGLTQARTLTTAFPGTTRYLVSKATNSSYSEDSYKLALDKLSITAQATSINTELNYLNRNQQKPKQLFVFSDFQKNNFSQKTIASVPDSQQVFLVPIKGKPTPNVYVDSVWLDDPFVRIQTDVALHVRLRNGGNENATNCQTKFFVGDKQVATFSVAVPQGKAVSTTVRVRLETSELQHCRVELEDYPVTFDNRFYFTLQPAAQIKVADIAATGIGATQRLYANEPLFSYSSAGSGTVDYSALRAADIVLVQGMTSISSGLQGSLSEVVQRGGTVVLVPSESPTGRASYEQLFQKLGVGPVVWEAAATSPVLQDIAQPDVRSPFFRDVFGIQNRQPVMPKAAPVLRWSRSDVEIMRLRSGGSFLSGFKSGKGMVYLFSTPFESTYTDFTQHALFVPVMYRLAMQSFQRDAQSAYRLNQGTVAVNVGKVAAATTEEVYKLTKDSAAYIPAQRVRDGVLRFDVPPNLQEPGFYKLTRAGKEVTTLAFNFDKRESELASYSADELRSLVGTNHPNIHVYEAGSGESVAARYKAERVGTPLWQYCLWAALACLLAEVLLIRFMGRAKTPGAVAVAA